MLDLVGSILQNIVDAKNVDLSEYPDGTYFIRISDQDNQYIGTEKNIQNHKTISKIQLQENRLN